MNILNLGLDGNEANVEKRVGVGKYAYEMLRHLYKIRNRLGGTQSKIRDKFQIYLKDKPLCDLPEETDWWQYEVVGPKELWTQIGLPLALYNDSLLKGRGVDVFFTPTHYAPRFSPCPRVISIMDLSFLHYPEMFRKQDLWQLKNWTAYSVKKAKKILTISYSTKNDIIKYYHMPEEKVLVTYPGFTMNNSKKQIANSKNTNPKLKSGYGIEGDYILSVGTLQPRKNYIRLIEALSILVRQLADPNIFLVIVGKKGWLYEEILEAPKKFRVEDKVKFLDYVPDKDMPSLYQNAKCFVLVSLYEGFGLPALEAMAYGCPVVVSNVSSLPEVVGEAGILVDPYNVNDITKGLLKVLNSNTSEYEKYVRMGKQQASKFSWEKCARETLSVLKEVGGRHV